MKDASDPLEGKYRDMLLKRSGEERVKMGCSMHATAQALVRASALQADTATRKGVILDVTNWCSARRKKWHDRRL